MGEVRRMEVGAVIVALMCAAVIGGWWAYRYERRIYRVVHRPSVDVVATASPPCVPLTGTLPAATDRAAVLVAGAVRAPERPVPQECTSVLGWDAFTLTSALALDGTVLLACRRLRGRPGETAELTLVLRIGDDHRADQALALLGSWQAGRTRLRVRPTSVAGAIEVFDASQTAIRAPLLSA